MHRGQRTHLKLAESECFGCKKRRYICNRYSPTVIATAITSQINKAKMPTHIEIDAGGFGLSKDSVVLAEQIRTIDKRRLKEKIGHVDGNLMDKVNEALEISFGLT